MSENSYDDSSHGARNASAPARKTAAHGGASSGGSRSRDARTGRRRLSLLCAGGVLTVSCLGMLIVRSAIRRDHVNAVNDYKANNFINAEKDAGGNDRFWGRHEGADFDYTDDGTYCDGITVNGVPIGGLTYDEARLVLLDSVSDDLLGINMTVKVGNVSVLLSGSSFTVSTDLDDVLHEAFMLGRESTTDPYANYTERVRIASEGAEFSYKLTLDEDNVRSRVDAVAQTLDHGAVEPYVTLKNLVGGGKPGYGSGGSTSDVFDSETVYAPNGAPIAEIIYHYGADGRILDRESLADSIIDAFNAGDYSALIEPVLNDVSPSSTPDELKASFTQLSCFSTNFTSSSSYRARNVQKANALLNCIVMAPGEELSYNELLGPRTEAGGWLQAPGISGGKEYVDSPGGGICQISSTLYNALLLLGDDVNIISRQHHSIPGSYVDLGLDATVSTGGPDLVWSAASDSPLFLLTYTDMDKRIAYAYVYGRAREDGCSYKVWSETISVTEPPASLRVEEPLWPTGYSKTTVTPRKGYVVNVYRQKLGPDGEPIGEAEYLYQDIYSAVRGEVHYGTGDPSLPKP